MKLGMGMMNGMGIGALAGKIKGGVPLVCPTNFGNLGGPATGYQGSPTQNDFEAYWPEDGLAYLGISPSEPSTFYTGFIRVGPLNKAPGSALTFANLTWRTDTTYPYHAYKTFIFRIYGVKSTRSPIVTASNRPTAQVLTTAYVEVDLRNWAGFSNSTYWTLPAQVINVAPIVLELLADPCHVSGNYPQFVLVPVSYPYSEGYITFGGQGLGNEILFNYA